MALQFLGGDTGNGGSPRLYRDGDDYLVQGYQVTEPELLAKLRVPPGESVVRVPGSLWRYLQAAPRTTGRSEGDGLPVPGGEAGGIVPAGEQQGCQPSLDQVLPDGQVALVAAARAAEPLSEYLWFDRAGVSLNIETGERDRWLLGHAEPARALPGYDLRIANGAMMVSNRFTADGKWAGSDVVEDPALARQCGSAFKIVRGMCPRTGPHRPAQQ